MCHFPFPNPIRFLLHIFPHNTPLDQGNALNLNRHALWQLLNGNTAPGWLVGEELLVRAVHLSEVVHGRDEHVDLDDLLER